ncbi:MAG: ATP-binding protein [Blastococcus sp.]
MTGPGAARPHPGSSVDGLCASTDSSCPEPTTFGERGTGARRRVWRLPATESSVPSLRRGLHVFLDGSDLSGDERYDLLLAVCEAASNAIEHARDPSEPFIDVLSEISDGRVTVVVRDHGQWSSVASGAHRGRGLQMMWLLADTTLAPSPRGTTVTIRSQSSASVPGRPARRARSGGRKAPFRPPPWAAYDRLGAVAATDGTARDMAGR